MTTKQLTQRQGKTRRAIINDVLSVSGLCFETVYKKNGKGQRAILFKIKNRFGLVMLEGTNIKKLYAKFENVKHYLTL